MAINAYSPQYGKKYGSLKSFKKFKQRYMKDEEREDDDVVRMDKDEYLEEHRRLIKRLRSGSRKELLEEAKLQEEDIEDIDDDE